MAGLSDEEWEAARALLKSLAHDLNNLLAPLYLYGEVLEESLMDPVQKQRASAILQRSRSMQDLVESARWIYKEKEDGEALDAEIFCRRLAALTRSLFQEKSLRACWVVPKQPAKFPGITSPRRFRLAAQIGQLASQAPPSTTVLIIFAAPGLPAVARAYTGKDVASAAKRFEISESSVTPLDDAAIESLVASLGKCQARELGV